MKLSTSYDLELRAAFFDNAQESFVILDKDLNFIDMNESLLESLGLDRAKIVGKNICEISPGIENTERYQTYLEVLKTGIPQTLDDVRVQQNIGNFVTRISLFKVGDGLGLAALNVSDLKDAINELETFSYRSAHDMRSPIANILGLIDVAKKEDKDLNNVRDYLNTIKHQAERLDVILQKLVETARIRQGDKTLYPIDFQYLIDDILGSLAYVSGFDGIDVTCDISVSQRFYSDKPMIISLLQNLIDNAVKYRKEKDDGSFLQIVVADHGDGVKITVADNGIGIKAHLQKDVFSIFFRATNQSVGSGLGLYTVKHCVKKLGGQIGFKSKEHEGTTFTVYLPNEKIAEA